MSVIVVDSSVWIAQLRGMDGPAVRRLREVVRNHDEGILVGNVILLEVLQGARDDAHAARIEQTLRQYPVADMLNIDLAIRAAANDRTLRAKGVTVRKTIDVIIGSFCLLHDHVLLHNDRDFIPMSEHLGLRVIDFEVAISNTCREVCFSGLFAATP